MNLVILGAGGHGRVVADAALASGRYDRVSATDRDPARCVGELVPMVPLRAINAPAAGEGVHVAIGNAAHRERECNALGAAQLQSVVHPDATVSPSAQAGAGCFIAARAVVAPGAVLGTSVIVNHGAVVDHDVRVGDFTHIAPQVALGGGAVIGSRVLVGAGAVVLPGVRIADDVIVGAGAVVREHITQAGVHAGVPARRMK